MGEDTEASLDLPRYLAESVKSYLTHLRHTNEALRYAESLCSTSQAAPVQSSFSRNQKHFIKVRYNKDMQVSEVAQDEQK